MLLTSSFLFPAASEAPCILQGSAVSAPLVHVGLAVLDEGTAAVIDALQKQGVLLMEEKYAHKYPYDWRTKLPTIFRATDQASMTEASTNP